MPSSANDDQLGAAVLPLRGSRRSCALTPDQAAAFVGELQELDADPRVRAIIIELTGMNPTGPFVPSDPRSVPARAIAATTTPTIAAITRDCFDQRLEAALACDVRLADAKARFAMRYVPNGHLPSDGGTQRLTRLVGRGGALYMLLTGRVVGAEHALRMGVVDRVIDRARFDATTESVALGLVDNAPVASLYVKEAVHAGADLTLAQGLALEHDLSVMLHSTRDRAEGLRAFAEGRKPEFEGE